MRTEKQVFLFADQVTKWMDATENYVYVADMINLRILRLRKKFTEEVSVDLR